jgi:signal transduction histidine kinase
VTSTGVSSLYTVILIGGILLGAHGSFGVAALSALAVAAKIYLDSGANLQYEEWVPAVTVTLNFALVAVVAWLGERSIIGSLSKASTNKTLLDQRSAQLQAAADIGMAAATSKDVDGLLRTVTQVISERFGFYHVAIFKAYNDGPETEFASVSEGGKISNRQSRLKALGGKSIIAHVAKTGKPYLASDVTTDPLYLDNPSFTRTRSEITVPIFSGDQLFGVIDVLSEKDIPLGSDEMNALQVLATQIGSAISRHELLGATNRHLEELKALHSIAAAGSEATDEDDFLSRATDVVGNSVFPTNFGVLLLDEKARVLRHHASYSEKRARVSPPIPLGEGITGLVAITGQPVHVPDVSREPKYISVDPRVRSEICVPLKIADRVLGVLDVESYEINSFSAADEHLLQALAGQIATSLERIRLLAEAQQRADELVNTLKQQKELARLRDEFVQNVSHEFRTPLAIVAGYIEILESREFGPLPQEYRQPINIIAKRVRLLSKLVEDLTALLDLAAHEGDFTILRISDLITPLYAEFRMRALSEQIELTLDVESSLPSIRGEETLLRKAVDSLVENAIKFTPPSGRVEIRAKAQDHSVLLQVSDTGVGFPPEEKDRIFERFYQVDGTSTRRFGGAGLGLALVKQIVDLHGGKLSVQSELGQGSTFQISLPALS